MFLFWASRASRDADSVHALSRPCWAACPALPASASLTVRGAHATAGEGWGYFIVDEFMVMMCADIMVMAMAAIFSTISLQLTGMRSPVQHPTCDHMNNT